MYPAKSRLLAHIRPPKERSGLLARPRLTGALVEAALNRRLVLVTAPSVFGKTTLLADAFRKLETDEAARIWLSVTDADRDPVWLGRMLLEQLAEQYQAQPLEGEDFGGYVNRLGGGTLVVVMIDNWNFIESEATNHYFDRLLRETEGLANFVVASRSHPGFLFETYRMSDDYAAFGMRDLTFSAEEAQAFLLVNAPPQPAEVLHRLVGCTEGWAAGLQLLRLALNQVGRGGAARIKFSGSRADVADYLNKTLFSHLPPGRRALLCSLAVLDEVSRELAAQVMDDPRAAADFAGLERDNIFLTETGDGSQRFRFHSLFRDFLLSQHGEAAALPQEEILRRAGAWHTARGELEVAIPYAIRAGEAEQAVALLEDYARRRLVADGKIFLFTEWISAFLNGGGALSPLLEHWYRWSLVFSGRWTLALNFQAAEPTSREVMIDAVICAFSDDQPGLRNALERWNADGATGDAFSVAVMRCAAAVAEMARGNLNAAAQNIHRAKFSVERTDSGFGRAWVLALSALVTLMKGRAREAEEDIREAIKTTDRMTGPGAPIARLTRQMAAVIAYHRGDAEMAATDLAFARLSPDEHGLPFIVVWAAAVARALGGGEERRFEAHLHAPAVLLIAETYRIEAVMREGGDAGRALHMAEAFEARLATARDEDPALMTHGWTLREMHTALLARAAMLRGENEAALHLLTPVISACQRDGRGLAEQKLNLLKIALLIRQNKRPLALRLLIQTADAAVRSGLYRFFIDDRRLIEPLLPALFEAGERAPLGNDAQGWRQFAAMLGHSPLPAARAAQQVSELDEDLQVTARETEMLGFLDIGLSNQEIGDRLGITVPTVKWHLHNLFSKIAVRNRSSAVRFARDNRLI